MPIPELEHNFDALCVAAGCDRLAQYAIRSLDGPHNGPVRLYCRDHAQARYDSGPVYVEDDATRAHERSELRGLRASLIQAVSDAFDNLCYEGKHLDTAVGAVLDILSQAARQANHDTALRRSALAFPRPYDAQERQRAAYAYAVNMSYALQKALELVQEATAYCSGSQPVGSGPVED